MDEGTTVGPSSASSTPIHQSLPKRPPAAPPAAPDDDVAAAPANRLFSDLREIVTDLAHSRDLLIQLTLRDIRVRYKQAVLGFLWALVMPTVIVLAGLAVRVAIAYSAGRVLNMHQVAAMAVKAVPWAFFVGCISNATPSLTSSIALVTKIHFPREVLPIGAVLAQTFDSTIGAVLICLALPFFHIGVSTQLVWVPVLIACLWILSLAAALFLSCANLFFRDVKYLVQVFLTFGIFITPVFMDASMFGPKGAAVMMMNPVAPILEGLRLAVVEHHNLLKPFVVAGRASGAFVIWHPWYLAYSGGIALGGLLLSSIIFHRSERRFAEII